MKPRTAPRSARTGRSVTRPSRAPKTLPASVRLESERERHLAQTEYVSCPHCACPVHVGETLQRTIATFASALLPHVPHGPLRKALDQIALFAHNEAWFLAQDTAFELIVLRDLKPPNS